MNLQNMRGGVVNAAVEKTSVTAAQSTTASSGLRGSVLGIALSSFGGAQIAENLNSVTGFLSPELKADLVGSALDKIGASGADVTSLLEQLGINPAVLDNPAEATPEEFAQLSEHLQGKKEETTESSSGTTEYAAETNNNVKIQADEQGDGAEREADSAASDAGKDNKDDES